MDRSRGCQSLVPPGLAGESIGGRGDGAIPLLPASIGKRGALRVFTLREERSAFFVLAETQRGGAIEALEIVVVVVVHVADGIAQIGGRAAAALGIGFKDILDLGDSFEEILRGFRLHLEENPSVARFVIGFHVSSHASQNARIAGVRM